MTDESKRQKVTHLTPLQHCLQRPEMYVGAITPCEHRLPVFESGVPTFLPVVVSPALINLGSELSTNALDNIQRDATQRYIEISWDGTSLDVANDGSTIPVEQTDDGQWVAEMAFGTFQSGSNFDEEETGKKDTKYTAGRNGIGAKGCVAFADRFSATIGNAQDRKTLTVVWESNMSRIQPIRKPTAWTRKTNRTHVSWVPDFARLGGVDGKEHMGTIASWLAHNAALCAPRWVKVSYNGQVLKLRSVGDYCRAFGAKGPIAIDTITHEGVEVARVAVAARDPDVASPEAVGITHGFVNSTPCCEGSHARMIHSALGRIIDDKANGKRGVKDIHCTPLFLRQHAVVVAVVLVDNERYTSQTKRCLDTPVASYGWPKWEPSPSFKSAVERSPIVDRIIELTREKEDEDASKATKTKKRAHPTSAKYERAYKLGKPQTTLIIAEGDSAGNFVRSGISSIGRDFLGLYPLRGKFLNTRGVSNKDICQNKEAMEMLQILGIQLNMEYTSEMVAKLPYQRLMVMSDQDVDGSHIAGLVFNFIDACAPSLLAVKSDYLCRFATSLIRVTLGAKQPRVGFYSQIEYDTWCDERRAVGESCGTAEYFKGLGTSSAADAKEYFKNLKQNTIILRHTGAECADTMDMAFNKKRKDDRKRYLTDCDPDSFIPYNEDETTLSAFVRLELLPQYALATLDRAIPSLDGFKNSQRKILFGARVLNMRGTKCISVANAAGKIASRTNYHHRGTAMEDAIILMAASYAGTSNINLFKPLGQFGERHNHTAASAAYPKIVLNDPIQDLLYPPMDDAILTYVFEEGHDQEPTVYYPIIAMPLIMGAKGIATAWSTDIPRYHPMDVIDATCALLRAEEPPPLTPWYRGFSGSITATDDGAFLVRGLYHWEGNDLHVREVPPMREVEAYKEDWCKAELATEVYAGVHNMDDDVHIILKACTLPKDTDLTKRLGLEHRISLTNMHLLNATGKLNKYDSPYDILRAHMALRMEGYTCRLDHILNECERKWNIADNRLKFVQCNLDGRFDMRQYTDDEEARRRCGELGLQEVDGSYDYLFHMKMSSLNKKRVQELMLEMERQSGTLAKIKATTPTEEWIRELTLLREELSKDTRYARS